MKLKLFFSYLLVMLVLVVNAQQQDSITPKNEQASLNSGSLSGQFDYMLKKSGKYQEYKVIKKVWLNRFKAQMQDSLLALRSEIKQAYTKNEQLDEQIVKLQSHVDELQHKLDSTINDKHTMNLMGVGVTKSTYSTTMWTVVFMLLITAVFCVLLFRRSNKVTIETKQTLKEVREEFEEHRKNALVREQKLARKLQDEVIKNKNNGIA